MRLVFMGSGEFAVPTLRRLAQGEHEVECVITQPAREKGRGRKVSGTPVKEMAAELGLPVFEFEDINTPDAVEQLRRAEARLALVIAFGQKLRPGVMGAFPAGCINLHASLLPAYRGAAPINWAIVNGEEKTGVTVFRIVDKMDAGPILTSRWSYIKPDETAGELHDRLAGIGVDAMMAALAMFDNEANPPGEPQDESQVTIARKLVKADGFVRFDRSAEEVAAHICGMTPWPGASAEYHAADGRWEKVIIARARPAEPMAKPAEPPGVIDKRLFVATSDGYLELLEVKPSSGRMMTWLEYINGRRVKAGDVLRTPGE